MKSHENIVEESTSGRYQRLDVKLGKGSFKEVYKAFDTHKNIYVAWNSIDLSSTTTPQDDKQNIFKECEILQKLDHPNILKIKTQWFNHKSEKLCFITNIFNEGSLATFFNKKKRHTNLLQIKQISKQILQALLYLHNNGIIHRDLKCDNIFLTCNTNKNYKIVLGDFGLSCNISSAKSMVGTVNWMAPEIYKEDYNEMIDIWAFGMCILELVTCLIPYNECKNMIQVVENIRQGKKPETFYKITNRSVREFINICLNIDPKMRPSAQELLDHPFLYSKVDDSRIILSNKLAKVDKPIRNDSAMVSVKEVKNNGNNINIELKIYKPIYKEMNVTFDFSHKQENPSNVAKEMIKDLELPNNFADGLEKAIKNAIDIFETKSSVSGSESSISESELSDTNIGMVSASIKYGKKDSLSEDEMKSISTRIVSNEISESNKLMNLSVNSSNDNNEKKSYENIITNLNQINQQIENIKANKTSIKSYCLVCGCSLFVVLSGFFILFAIYLIYIGLYQPSIYIE